MEHSDAKRTDETLEERLGRLRPAPVPPELMERLRAARLRADAAERRRRGAWIIWSAAVAAAVCLALFINGGRSHRTGMKAGEGMEKVWSGEVTADIRRQCFLGARDAGKWTAPDGRVYKVIHCLSVDQASWQNFARDMKVDLFKPKQRVLLLAMKDQ